MSKRAVYSVFGLAVFIFVSCHSAFSQSCRLALGDDGDSELWLEGTVGESRVRAYFNTEPDGKLTGIFYDVSKWSPVALEGIRGDDCRLRMVEAGSEHRNVAWEGILKNGVFEGTRRNRTSGENSSVHLQKTIAVDCNGKGKWTQLRLPESGISLEYPETWRIVERSVTRVRLMCPDPRAMQFSDSGVSIDSQGPPDALTEIGRFSKLEGKWLVGSADVGGPCESSNSLWCTEARVSRQSGMTVVYGSGSTEEEAYLLLFKDGALYVSSGFVDKRTTARIVRSVRPVNR